MEALRELIGKTSTEKPIRYSCSDIAGITGYHPYSDVIQLVDKYLYQDLSILRDLDASALGIEFVDVETQVEDILQTKLLLQLEQPLLPQKEREEGKRLYETLQDLKQTILNKENDEKLLINQQQTQQMLETVQQLFKDTEHNKVIQQLLTEEERWLIQKEYEYKIKTQYGIRCEEKALNKYEEMTGYEVVRRNDQYYILEVMPLNVGGETDADINDVCAELDNEDNHEITRNDKKDTSKGQLSISSFLNNNQSIAANIQSSESSVTCNTGTTTNHKHTDASISQTNKKSLLECWMTSSIAQSSKSTDPVIIDLCDSSSEEGDSDGKDELLPIEIDITADGEESQISLPSAVQGIVISDDREQQSRHAVANNKRTASPTVIRCSPVNTANEMQGDNTDAIELPESTSSTAPNVLNGSHKRIKPSIEDASTSLSVKSSVNEIPPQVAIQREEDHSIISTAPSSQPVLENSQQINRTLKKKVKQRPAFKLIGKIDGMAEHIDCESEDVNQWKSYNVVVEMKNRVHRVSNPPPLYDQIQLVSYMLMTNTTCGDLVQSIPQVVKSETGEVTDASNAESSKEFVRESTTVTDFLISRVQLDGPPYYHKHHWDTVIMPRMHVFNDMIALLRKDDGLRYSYLLASENEKLGIIASLCPYISL